MKFEIKSIPSTKIAYVRRIGPYGQGNLETMAQLKKWAKKNELLEESIIFARVHDNPMITPPENCRYDACIVIEEDYKIQDSSISTDFIQGGMYAVVEIQHTDAAVEKAWHYVFEAIARKKVDYNHLKPILERYKDELIKKNKCEICVPI